MIDLHLHTTASDGTIEPKELIRLAYLSGIQTCAITDHDTMSACQEAMEEGTLLGVTVIPGIEISTGYQDEDIHVLGYGMDPNNPKLKPVIEYVSKDRKNRNQKIIALMEADGVIFRKEDLDRENLGRAHFAQVLVREGKATSIQDAFDRYLGKDCQYFIPRSYIPIQEAVQTIHACQGITILAHPYQYDFEDITAFLEEMKEIGIDGIEAYYSGYDASKVKFLVEYAQKNHMLVTGGSDFHGSIKSKIFLGQVEVPDACATQLIKKMKDIQQ